MSRLICRFILFIAMAGVFAGVVSIAPAQTNYYVANGIEYPVVGSLPGDQVFPNVALTPTGGMIVWQDNATDGSGWGISARRVDSTLSGTLSAFRVNADGTNDQENARVAMLKNGGAAFVWQGGKPGFQHIYARFLTASNTFATNDDILVNSLSYIYQIQTNTVATITTNWGTGHNAGKIMGYTTNTTTTVTTNMVGTAFQENPAVGVLNNSNVVVVWASLNQAGSSSMQDVYGQIFSPAGQKVGGEFLINQFTSFNQRTPTVVALSDGGFAVAWVSEQSRVLAPSLGANSSYSQANAIIVPSVDIFARRFQSNGTAVGNEFRVNTDDSPCANPAATSSSDGTYLVAWSARDAVAYTNGWDVKARIFPASGPAGATFMVNTHIRGNQYAPQVAALGPDYLVTWTSMGQDGSREGVFGQVVHSDGSLTGTEFRVNNSTASQQIQPALATDGASQFLVVWSSYVGGSTSFDLYARRYINADGILAAMPAPFVHAPFTLSNGVYQPELKVSWAPLAGISVTNYEVYVDGAVTPTAVTASNSWTMTAARGLTAGSTHSFQVAYVKVSGARSPLSESASGTTWGGLHWGGIPFEWMTANFGGDLSLWPSANSKVAAQGPTVMQVFLSGAIPSDPSTWLTTQIANTKQGAFLSWNTQPGFIYQVQATTNFTTWSNWGEARFAAGTTDSIYLGNNPVGFYRVLLVR